MQIRSMYAQIVGVCKHEHLDMLLAAADESPEMLAAAAIGPLVLLNAAVGCRFVCLCRHTPQTIAYPHWPVELLVVAIEGNRPGESGLYRKPLLLSVPAHSLAR